ncbi:oligosaccharyl transferase, STT3 subunit [Pyrococcus furiosus DSM 3638]|uniref:Dolichyl-phosphooligosaccharide-protein glycotransferase 2 n=3 Tax=Pyrococcus furiosus TaxID=2261 RepID=AGLB2_PYRFU|nr:MULTISPECIES: STT3 domain-containing protein [Pyrococcus]Q8U3P6.1 RecName: Full=Dolichyl-phosphooligosaccharide-protein glycotransferase 2; AltName: Full=Archaeal glycosylation protein B; Short=AglB-S; Short=AglB-Short; AltName: Full=Oligosaccharyl transferase; Short=OST; Short=OTase [Pyrococcus furiosus DSM 3638]AAL80535.1 protein-export membrane protein [Pyrococcus furiosus DSM 3638]AFN03201.1 protein-export membrane protein [Pyrococcus furiosus COM1]MDK2869258.1 dolichyl-phosphooligosacch
MKIDKRLMVIVAIATLFRMIPFRLKYLVGSDPYFHLAYIEEALKAGEWFNFFTYAGGPWGLQVRLFHPLGLWATPAYIYKLFSFLGISLYTAFRVTPVIFGVLTVVFFYLSLKKLYNRDVAFIVGLFLGVNYGHIFRSMANYYRGDNYMLFWYSVALLGIALGLKTRSKYRYLFYLLPGIATGFASAFWQAYYPIFVFVLAGGLLLGVYAYLKSPKLFLDSILIVLSTGLGVLIANILGDKVGYGMLGYTDWMGKKVAETFGLEFGFIKDAYLLIHVKYLLPLSLVFLGFLIITKKLNPKIKVGVLVGGSILAFIVMLVKFPALKDLSTGFGTFREVPISETLPPTLDDLWRAYNIAIFLAALYILRLRKIRSGDAILLGYVITSLWMLRYWTRFLFTAAPAVAFLSGIGVYELTRRIKENKIRITSLGVVILLSSAFSLGEVYSVKPFMNENWEKALIFIRENSNENDIVLTWWDWGHFVTYYARRSPVAQGSPNSGVAGYYLGLVDNGWAQSLGVDYVIVSLYDILKFEAIVDTAKLSRKWENISRADYGVDFLKLTESTGSILRFDSQYSTLIVKEGNIRVILSGKVVYPREAIIESNGRIKNLKYPARSGVYVYVNLDYGYAILANEKAWETNLLRLFTQRTGENYELVYSDGGFVKVFRFVHPNVVFRGNKFILTGNGTGLGLYGYLDNGTLVFKKWYSVKNMQEFELPNNLNGSVVVRYVYTQGKIVLDRGIVRVKN